MFSGEGILKKRRGHLESNFELQITALIDTLVIILIFLLKSISIDSLEIETAKKLSIPTVNAGVSTGKGAILSVSQEAVSWNKVQFIGYQNFQASDKDNSIGGKNWSSLSEAIAETAKQEKAAGEHDGKLLFQADKNAPFPLVKAALKAARENGYKDIKFVGAKLE
jgi:biopolymer transport protein ExbD